MGINFRAVKVAVTQVIDNLLSDPELARDVTYKKYGKEAFDNILGYTAINYVETTIRAIKLKHNDRSEKLNIANVQAGDTVYLVKNEDMPIGASLKDLIIDGTEIMKIKSLQDIFQLAWGITTESK